MKKSLLICVAVFCFIVQSEAQTVVLNETDSYGSILAQYTITGSAGSRSIKWEAWVESYTPYIEDIYSGGQENMFKFNVNANVPNSDFELFFDNSDFPYGGASYYSRTVDLSGLTDAEIESTEVDVIFHFIFGGTEEEPEYHSYDALPYIVI